MYSYMGRVYGIPDIVLYLGASYAQLQAGTFEVERLMYGTWGDDPMDQKNIERGIEFYKKTYTKGELCNE